MTAMREINKAREQDAKKLRDEALAKLGQTWTEEEKQEYFKIVDTFVTSTQTISRTWFLQTYRSHETCPVKEMQIALQAKEPHSSVPFSKLTYKKNKRARNKGQKTIHDKDTAFKDWILHPEKTSPQQIINMFRTRKFCGHHGFIGSTCKRIGIKSVYKWYRSFPHFIYVNGRDSIVQLVLNSHYHILVHVPKCAGSSMSKQLQEPARFGHMLSCYYPAELWHRLVVFVRNPYDRIVSTFNFALTGGFPNISTADLAKLHPTFRSWVLNYIVKSTEECKQAESCTDNRKTLCSGLPLVVEQYKYVYNQTRTHRIIPDCRVGRFENLQADFIRLFLMQLFVVTNKREHNPWQTYYQNDLDLAQIIYDLYKRDFEEFNYPITIQYEGKTIFTPTTTTTATSVKPDKNERMS